MTTMSRSAIRIATLVLIAVLFLAVNLFSNIVFRSAQIDLTQSRLFTLSQGTENVLAKIDEPITLKFFYSESLATDFPQVRAYANRVRDLLEEIRDRSHGKIVLEVVDPEPFSEQEDLAMSLGLKGARTTEGEVIYFGLVGTNLVDGIEAIPFFTDERQQYLEYDVTRLIQNLSRPKKPVLGIVTNIPLDTGSGGLMAAMRGQSQPFAIYQELQNRFEINFLEQKFVKVPADVDVLMIAHPKQLDQETLYAIDQFVMRGGRVLAFVDPHSEVSLTAGPDGQPVQGYTEASDLAPLLKDWGVDYDTNHIVGDRDLAMRVQTGLDARRQTSDYVLWLSVPKAEFDQNDIVTSSIDHINLGTAGLLKPAANATTRFTPLFWSSKDAETYDLDYVKAGHTPDELLNAFKPTGETYVLAARVSGPLKSAFSAAPALPVEDETKRSDATDKPDAFIAQTKADANIIVVADSDILDDRFWTQVSGDGNDRTLVPFADNAKFVLSAIDNLMGSDDLISLRARERVDRPFVVVDNLRREAERKFLTEQERLKAKITETEQRLAALQTEGAGPNQAAGVDSSDPHAQEEIAQFRTELLQSRKALRDVQRNLRRDIDRLATEVRFANVALMPILVAIVALGIAVLRHRRRKARAGKGA
ncbi:GldG family protein [Parvibaculum sp.]|uniref:GldG family protein n=1 Tax=Parvibaculum sp. TaxID=2024848 RepID=UPI002D06BAB8|nr:Gldg family protein [Parvibaculum sp.]HUD50118.1 Gldg family protein [Parvibaculum sp.]